MAPAQGLESLSNPLATPAQLSTSSSSLDEIPAELENSIRFAGSLLTQAAGVLLRLPQDVIAQAIVLFTRFWVGPDGGSLAVHSAKDVSAASVYLTAKLSFHPQSPRSVLTVYKFLLSEEASPLWFVNPRSWESVTAKSPNPPSPESYYLSEGQYQSERLVMLRTETMILRILGFNTHVAVPHTIALTYLQTMNATSPALAKRVFEHLNASLLSPQLLYLTHQPNALAVAAIYLAAREVGVKLVDGDWWEIFDVEREDLGFLVVAMKSTDGFANAEKEKWAGRAVPLLQKDLAAELTLRAQADADADADGNGDGD